MSAVRSLGLASVLVSAVVVSSACVAINEAVTGRDLDCGASPQDICIRVADWAQRSSAGDLRRNFRSGDFTIVVTEGQCSAGPGQLEIARCWDVLFTDEDGRGIGTYVLERPDGTLGQT